MRLAGITVPLFSLRSPRGGTIGEIDDLAGLVDWAADYGQRVIALLPLGELAAGEASPYNALSSFAIDPLYLTPETMDELRGESLPPRPVSTARDVDREAARRWKDPLFDEAHRRFRSLPADHARRRSFEKFRGDAAWLDDYALFRALLDEHQGGWWRHWPAAIRERDGRAMAAAKQRLGPRIDRVEYLQFAADTAWRKLRARAASRSVLLMGDLPFAPSENSADVWESADLFDAERSVGAPPDAFSETGQRWGLPMVRWEAMRRGGWRWLRSRVRRMAELYDLFRVDHVVGLFRTFGFVGEIPDGFDPPREAEQIAQGREILTRMLDESGPARPVAEDLGVIPPFVIETLAALDIPGHQVLRWVEVPPHDYPECSMATTGTHDTETVAVWWNGLPAGERTRVLQLLGLPTGGSSGDLSDDLRRAFINRLYQSPSRLVVLPIQDLFGWSERVNTPATVSAANWAYRLPGTIEDLAADPAIRAEMDKLRELIDAARRLRRMGEPGSRSV